MKVCPYLGKIEDPDTPVLFPSRVNGCHRSVKVWKPDLDTQEKNCLSENFVNCPVYLQKPQTEAEVPSLSIWQRHKKIWVLLLVGVLLLLVDLAVIFFLQSSSMFGRAPAASSSLPALIEIPTTTPLPARPTATPQPSATFSHTPSLMPSITQRVAARVDLDEPFGGQVKFVIHRLKAGDSFSELSARFSTSIDVIRWVNHDLHVPLWEGELVIIPVEIAQVDPSMPVFETYQVSQPMISARNLAAQLQADETLLCTFNNLQPDDLLPEQHWLIIPRERE